MKNLILGDCIAELKKLSDNSIDSLVTDPPAGISFMNKEWDKDKGGRDQWIKWLSEVMTEVNRVLKPGAHGLVWSIPRTAHWTAMALEYAGFEVRDCVTHLFGSGFPKSLNISKAIDKEAGVERTEFKIDEDFLRRNPGKKIDGKDRKKEYSGTEFKEGLDAAKRGKPATTAAKQWDGYGTALKPAVEMWWLVRKPISEKTVAKNILKWGVGGLNIDGCRVGTETITQHKRDFSNIHGNKYGPGVTQPVLGQTSTTQGRFPANLVLSHHEECELSPHVFPDGTTQNQCHEDCAVRLLDEQSGISKSPKESKNYGEHSKRPQPGANGTMGDGWNGDKFVQGHGDSGGASRFFYVAKASKSERNAGLEGMPEKILATSTGQTRPNKPARIGADPHSVQPPVSNFHPTVKPIKLMSYLCKLITPPNGVILDPFMGSGSTGVAAKKEGFGFIGIEMNEEYYQIASKRIESVE